MSLATLTISRNLVSDQRKNKSWTEIHHQKAAPFLKIEENKDSA